MENSSPWLCEKRMKNKQAVKRERAKKEGEGGREKQFAEVRCSNFHLFAFLHPHLARVSSKLTRRFLFNFFTSQWDKKPS